MLLLLSHQEILMALLGTTFCQETDMHQHYIEPTHGVYQTKQPEKD